MDDNGEYFVALAIGAVVYVGFGLFSLGLYPENVFLGGILFFLGGLIPNLDSHKGTKGGDLVGIVAASSPLLLSREFPELSQGGISRMVFFIIVAYVALKFFLVRMISTFTTPRGMLHSVPAAILFGQIVYLVFVDLYWQDRLFQAAAVSLGMLLHLSLDGAHNLKQKGKPAMKIAPQSGVSTLILYGVIGLLGWFVVSDIQPHARYRAPSSVSQRR